jgi:hypothetical protein
MDRWEVLRRVGRMTLSEVMTTRDPEILAAMDDILDEVRNIEPEVLVTVWVDGRPYPQY